MENQKDQLIIPPVKTLRYKTFREFYPFYLTQHQNKANRILHYIGTCGAIIQIIRFALSRTLLGFLLIPLIGYGFAWVGHFFFEKNKPATFQYPFWSLMGDFQMLEDAIKGALGRPNTMVQKLV